MHLHLQDSNLICVVFLACADEFHLVSWLDGAVDNLEICDDSSE